MIKGCSKRVIVMKETGNDMIEEAFFILKPQSTKKNFTDADIMTQAKILLEKHNAERSLPLMNVNSPYGYNVVKKKRHSNFTLPFTLGLLLGALLSAALIVRLPV